MKYYSAFKNKEILSLSDTMTKPGGQYTKWNKPVSHRKANAARFYLYEAFMTVQFTVSKHGVAVARAAEMGKWGVTNPQAWRFS